MPTYEDDDDRRVTDPLSMPPPTDLPELFDSLMREAGKNTRDLAIIMRYVEGVRNQLAERDRKHSEDINAIHHLAMQISALEGRANNNAEAIENIRERLERISEIVVTGNGQKALMLQVTEQGMRVNSMQTDVARLANMLRDANIGEISNHDGTALERVETARAEARKHMFSALGKSIGLVGGGSGLVAFLWKVAEAFIAAGSPPGH